MTRTRLIACLLAAALAAPGAAWAQGAGDDQYQDPFADQPAAKSGGGGDGQGKLSNEPPVPGAGKSGSSGGSTGSAGSSGSAGTTSSTSTPAAEATGRTLPNTGSDPRPLALAGLAFLLIGIGLRLRTIDPDAF